MFGIVIHATRSCVNISIFIICSCKIIYVRMHLYQTTLIHRLFYIRAHTFNHCSIITRLLLPYMGDRWISKLIIRSRENTNTSRHLYRTDTWNAFIMRRLFKSMRSGIFHIQSSSKKQVTVCGPEHELLPPQQRRIT